MRRKPALSLRDWGVTLPEVAARVVAEADIGRPHVYLRFRADPGKLGLARTEIARWAQSFDLGVERTQDMVLAIDEATTNAVEHAYLASPGPVTLLAAVDRSAHAVRVVVSDCGTWRTPRPGVSTRGRGLMLMAALADECDVTTTQDGTTVILGWPLEDLSAIGGGATFSQMVRKLT